MPIYTRTGDKGKTSLFDGTRVFKSHPRVETYGTVDELNSTIGSILAHLPAKHGLVKKELEKIQHELFDIGSALATPEPLPVIGLQDRPKDFEKLIDQMTVKMPTLTAFIFMFIVLISTLFVSGFLTGSVLVSENSMLRCLWDALASSLLFFFFCRVTGKWMGERHFLKQYELFS